MYIYIYKEVIIKDTVSNTFQHLIFINITFYITTQFRVRYFLQFLIQKILLIEKTL